MDTLSNRDVLTAPTILCSAMLVVGVATATAAGVDGSRLILPYLSTAMAVTLICTLVYAFIAVARLAVHRADDPLRIVSTRLRERAPLLLLPTVIFGLFLAAYTTSKTSIPFLVGYNWDYFWAEADRIIFGRDVWLITHGLFGAWSMPLWEWIYTFAWGLGLVAISSLVALYASRRQVAIFFTTMLATWLLGGWLMAYCFSAAGPVFAHLVEPGLTARFLPLRAVLEETLAADSAVRSTQVYLAGALDNHVAARGGGISAMPSMHLGTASIYVIASWRTKWLVPAILFWLLIFIGSGHFGYHYWVDGLVAAILGWCCWMGSDRFLFPAIPRTLAKGERDRTMNEPSASALTGSINR